MPEVSESSEEVFFKWQPEYSVHIRTIDDQHQELVNILNRLFVAVFSHEGASAISGILDGLVRYTEIHFELEERLMRQANYADFEAHKLEHGKLMQELDRLCKKCLSEEKPTYFEMLGFLKRWLRGHIQGVDTRYSIALQRTGFSVTAWEQEASAEFKAMIEKRLA